jgi:hypothetical protein
MWWTSKHQDMKLLLSAASILCFFSYNLKTAQRVPKSSKLLRSRICMQVPCLKLVSEVPLSLVLQDYTKKVSGEHHWGYNPSSVHTKPHHIVTWVASYTTLCLHNTESTIHAELYVAFEARVDTTHNLLTWWTAVLCHCR